MRRLTWLTTILGLLLTVAPLSAEPAIAAEPLGVLYHEHPELRGRLLASGEDVAASGIVRTTSQRAVLHLDNGQVLKLDSNSGVLLERVAYGEVKVTVLSGCATHWSVKDRPLEGCAGGWFLLAPSSLDPMAAEAALLEHDSDTARRGSGGRKASRR